MKNWLFNQMMSNKVDGGWNPLRFTDDQLREYAKDDAYGIRSRCAAGMELTFLTDAKWLCLSLYDYRQNMGYGLF